MKRAVIYTRVSSRDQVEGYSLGAQLTACTAYCERHGLTVDRVFVEEGESAKTADRTELRNLLEHCRKGPGRLHALVVYNLSRFARDRFDHHALLAHLRRLGLVLRSVTEPVDETPSGELMDAILSGVHEFENRIRAERIVSGLQAALEAGRWVRRPPIGYRSTGGGVLEEDPERGPLVRWVFEQVATGDFALEEVRQRAVDRGLATTAGKPLPSQTLSRMLRNPLYAGRVVSEAWGIDAPADFAPLVDAGTWRRVQRVLDGEAPEAPPVEPRAVSSRLDHPDFPLRRFLRCAGCGVALTGSWSRGSAGGRYGYYHCRTGGCREVKARREDLEERWVAHLDALRPAPAYLRLLREEVLAAWRRRQEAAAEQRTALEARVRTLRDRRERLVEVYVYERGLDRDTYQRKNAELGEQLTLAELALADERIELLDVEGLLAFAEYVLTRAGRLWLELAPEHRRRFQRHLFPAGVVVDGEIAFRTEVSSSLFRPLGGQDGSGPRLVEQMGFEPTTPTLRTWCSPS